MNRTPTKCPWCGSGNYTDKGICPYCYRSELQRINKMLDEGLQQEGREALRLLDAANGDDPDKPAFERFLEACDGLATFKERWGLGPAEPMFEDN